MSISETSQMGFCEFGVPSKGMISSKKSSNDGGMYTLNCKLLAFLPEQQGKKKRQADNKIAQKYLYIQQAFAFCKILYIMKKQKTTSSVQKHQRSGFNYLNTEINFSYSSSVI